MGKYRQGQFTPVNKEKYIGIYPIIYRSGWERKFMGWLDLQPSILKWSSESIIIPYIHPIKKRAARYFPDFFMEVKEKNGKIVRYLVEVKPSKETRKPRKGRRKKASTLIYENFTYLQNLSKWAAAKRWCDKKGILFKIVTEKELF